MYADRPMLSQGPRPVSFGASLAVSSAIVAALIFASPDVLTLKPPVPIEGYNVPIPPIPDEIKPEPKPETEPQQPREQQLYVPETPVRTTSETQMTTTNVLPEQPPLRDLGTPTGTGETLVEPPKPLPALIGARIDPRFERYMQPDYPGTELRAEREGTVVVRVLIGIDGRVKAVEKVSATSDAFFEATRRHALGKWRFKPATRGGIPEESWKQMSLRFELKNS